MSEQVVEVLRAHLPRDRYDDEGASVGTFCTCGGWDGDYFADGEAGPFDAHLAEALERVIAERERVARAEVWDEGALWAAVECGAIPHEAVPWLGAGDNPYRTTEGDA